VERADVILLTFKDPWPMIVNRYGTPLCVTAAWVAASYEDMSIWTRTPGFIDFPVRAVQIPGGEFTWDGRLFVATSQIASFTEVLLMPPDATKRDL